MARLVKKSRKRKAPKTAWKKGHAPTSHGRPKGVPNVMTRVLKDAILLAAEASGSDGKGKDKLVGYLIWASRKAAPSFLTLLGRLLPLQIAATMNEDTKVRYKSSAEVRAELVRLGVPIDRLFDPPMSEGRVV